MAPKRNQQHSGGRKSSLDRRNRQLKNDLYSTKQRLEQATASLDSLQDDLSASQASLLQLQQENNQLRAQLLQAKAQSAESRLIAKTMLELLQTITLSHDTLSLPASSELLAQINLMKLPPKDLRTAVRSALSTHQLLSEISPAEQGRLLDRVDFFLEICLSKEFNRDLYYTVNQVCDRFYELIDLKHSATPDQAAIDQKRAEIKEYLNLPEGLAQRFFSQAEQLFYDCDRLGLRPIDSSVWPRHQFFDLARHLRSFNATSAEEQEEFNITLDLMSHLTSGTWAPLLS